jgi:hypothetical protein
MVYRLQYNLTPPTTPPPSPPTDTHCLYTVYSTVHLVWEGGEEVREIVEGQQYTSIVPLSMGARVHKLG